MTAPATTKPRILTGDTPTHTGLHLGHYVGSLENRLSLQDQYDCYFLIANVHAFTTLAEKPAEIRANTIGIVKDWLAVGLDPDRSTFVLQSEIPAIAELTFLFAMLIPFNKVMRNPTLKTEIETKGLGETYPFGFPMYAVGQCADILAFRPELVPVGEDQEAHIEMCRDVALKFNQLYCGVGNRVPAEEHAKAGGVFPIPKAKVGRIARLVGLDGVNKMSKSLGNAIFLYDSAKDVQKKINRITTGRQSPTEPGDAGNVLMQYVDAFIGAANPGRAAEIKDRYTRGDNIGDGHIKQELGEVINALIEPMRQRRAKLDGVKGDWLAEAVLDDGTKRANSLAEETLSLAKGSMGLTAASRAVQFLSRKRAEYGEITRSDIFVGSALFLDPMTLRRSGAKYFSPTEENAVTAPTYFVCVWCTSLDSIWVPVAKQQAGRKGTIAPAEKDGHENWVLEPSYYYSNQVWRAEAAAVVKAAFREVRRAGQPNAVTQSKAMAMYAEVSTTGVIPDVKLGILPAETSWS